jgi:PAS domain S-box-containing protein
VSGVEEKTDVKVEDSDLRDFFATSPVALYVAAPQRLGRLVYHHFGSAAADLLTVSIPSASLLFSDILGKVSDADREAYGAAVSAAVATQTGWSHDFRVIDDEGKTRWVKDTANPIKIDGDLVHWHGVFTDVTQTHADKVRSEQLEDWISGFSHGDGDWFWETDAEHCFVYQSGNQPDEDKPNYESPIGNTRADRRLEDDTDDEKWRRHQEDLDARRAFKDFLYSIKGANGERRFVRTGGKPFYDSDGVFLGFRGIARDVTDEIAANSKIVEARETLIDAIENISQGFAFYDAEDRLTYANQNFLSLEIDGSHTLSLGESFEELTRIRVDEGFFPEALGEEEDFIRNRVERHQNPPNDFAIEMKDGRHLQISERAMANGGIAVIYTDVTESKRIEHVLRRSQERFKDFAQATSDWYWETDREHRFQDFSLSKRRDLLAPTDDNLGQTRRDNAHPEDVAKDPGKWRRHADDLAHHRPFRDFVYLAQPVSGAEVWLRTSGMPIVDDAGDFVGYRGATTDITDDILAAEQARSARERLIAAMDGLNETFSFWDKDERLILANSAWRKATKRANQPAPIGEKFEDIVRGDLERGVYPMPSEMQERWLSDRFANFRNPGTSLEFQLRDERWVTIRDEKLQDGSTISIGLDITDWKSAESARLSTEGRLAGVLDTAAEAIVSIDGDYRITLFNKAAEAVFGYSAEEVLGQSINLLLPQRYRVGHNRQIGTFEDSVSVNRLMGDRGEVSGLRKDGSEFPAEASISKYQSDRETVFTVHVSDVTERHRARDALEKSEEQFRRVFDDSPLGMALVDASRRITLVNRKIIEILGYSEEELLGTKFSEITHPEDTAQDTDLVDRVMAGEFESYRREKRYLHKDGRYIDANLTATIIRDQSGNAQFLGMIEDVTEGKAAQTQLLQAQKLETVGTLAGGIAHDFNNILAPMMGYSELALDTLGAQHRSRRYIERIDVGIGRAAELVQQILTFTRPGAGEKTPVQVGDIVDEALKLLRAAFPATVTIQFSANDQGTFVIADPSHIHQIAMNLCTNAAQAMESTGGILEISIRPFDVNDQLVASHPNLSPGPHLLLSVSDTGRGMDEETQGQIFEPFFTTKGASTGTGLGLSTVYGIVSGLNGLITVVSTLGRGTRFDVYLPAIARSTASDDATVALASMNGCRVLLVDDDEGVLAMCRELLSAHNHSTVSFKDPSEALNAFRAAPNDFDVVLTDQSMPKVTGVMLARKIKEIRPDIRIVLMTGFVADTKAGDQIEKGIDDLIMKPFSAATLTAALRDSDKT